MMVTAILLFALHWPWRHVEHGATEIQKNGFAIVHFKKIFSIMPTCSGHPRSFSREWIELSGKPGTQIAWTCK
jgi:hypothetical protein